MIYIGVTGKPGAGKTTFSNFWAEKSNVGVIHVDELVNEIKLKYLGPFMTNDKNNEKIKVKPGLKKRVYKNKLAFKLLGFVRRKLVEKPIQRKIQEFKLQGKDIVIIDDWRLEEHRQIYSKLRKVFFVKRNFVERRAGILDRDEISLDELNVMDMPYALKYKSQKINPNYEIIENSGSLDELKQRVDREYEELGIMGFDEKYRITDKNVQAQISRIGKTVSKTGKLLQDIQSKIHN